MRKWLLVMVVLTLTSFVLASLIVDVSQYPFNTEVGLALGYDLGTAGHYGVGTTKVVGDNFLDYWNIWMFAEWNVGTICKLPIFAGIDAYMFFYDGEELVYDYPSISVNFGLEKARVGIWFNDYTFTDYVWFFKLRWHLF